MQITNNRRKSLLKSDIIINFDFSEEDLNRCTFKKRVIIINLKYKTKVKTKTFEGININDYEIEVKKEKIEKLLKKGLSQIFSIPILYESILYENNIEYLLIKDILKEDVKIKFLIGMNGKIQEKEFVLKENISINY